MRHAVKCRHLEEASAYSHLESDFIEKGCEKQISQDDLRFLRIVTEGIHQQEDGQFVLPLPFRAEQPNLPNNRSLARIRLEHLKRIFQKDPKYFKDYCNFMTDIMEKKEAEEIAGHSTIGTTWYIPHHGVYHPKKPEKIRVVFDCAAKFKGTSLNDHLLKGPDQLNTLVGVLCRFRRERVALICDIERMYHRFRVNEEDRNFLRFLWWADNDIHREPQEYRMKVHIFGAVSSPGCAIFALKYIAAKYQHLGLEAARFISKDFYMDDGLTSTLDVDTAITLIGNARNICAKGNLRLHKIASNQRTVIEAIPSSERAKNMIDLDLALEHLPIERALGIKWCIESDQFQFQIVVKDQPATRRGILSTVASVFDPLGLIVPFILQGKRILQNICRAGCGWDEPLPDAILSRWEGWRSQIPKLASVSLQRSYKPKVFGKVQNVQLHHFSEASNTGYGQCTYIRQVDDRDCVHCALVMGKSRVVPVRPVTMPRLELQAAVTSAKISDFVNEELDMGDITNHYWTDSRIVLAYLNNDAKRFHTYVANRIQRIQESTSTNQWHYVATQDNPVIQFDDKAPQIPTDDPEVKKAQTLETLVSRDYPAACRQHAEKTIIKAVQQVAFGEEIDLLIEMEKTMTEQSLSRALCTVSIHSSTKRDY